MLWPMHQRGEISSELKLDYTKEAALNKARDVVSSLGYNPTNLESHTRFEATDTDLKYLVTKEGRDEARRAAREGRIAVWHVVFALSSDEAASASTRNEKAGQFFIHINPQGQLTSFSTPPQEASGIMQVDQKQAVEIAAEQARRWLSFDPGGYDIEVVPRSNPSGLIEITWRNPNPIFAHREEVRANLQGTKITKLGRYLETPQSINETNRLSAALKVQAIISFLALVAICVFGVVFLISSKRWHALRRKLPIMAAALIAAGFLSYSYFEIPDLEVFGPLLAVITAVVFAVIVGVAFFPGAAGLFEWLLVFSPVRFFGAQQLTRRRFFSRSAASSLVHGVLGGGLLAGLSSALVFLMARVSGFTPSLDLLLDPTMRIIHGGWPLVQALLWFTLSAVVDVMGITILIELVERLVRKGTLVALISTFLIVLLSFHPFSRLNWITSYNQPGIVLVGLSFLATFLSVLIVVQLYRSRGLAAVWLALTTYGFLEWAAISRYLRNPWFVLQSNLLVIVVTLLLVAGIWGYFGGRIRTSLSSFALRRGAT